ncbi:hypothetical protein [Aliirhizobium cellulosilyticum]|uniref:Uncharacterized protein n=1 Tax=Aliirhizobium cellulosilyticum TaxID=393664 RepID=A0A7W6UU17_9HYPH|nr:hypothetical protein [Rhizobium cellulosilyticum]MBB4347923.1 hypothetical protein [Rhizobium cellulosilyticum]MBB4409683.1 hypothetical protein [Rhizobium cellulosilyticum]MBB4444370.1 hypothetical protein [Rhizobium cellulosilyticum]
MKNDRDLASEIVDRAAIGDVEGANLLLNKAILQKTETTFRAHSVKYLVALFCLTVICLGIDALDGHIIDHL